MPPNKPRGNATIKSNRGPVVPADAISLLSGVNFGSVVKMLAALHALQEFTGTDIETLVRLSDVPLERVQPERSEDADRARATRGLIEDLVDSEQFDELDEILHLRGRFGA
jgi:hypothetical protein